MTKNVHVLQALSCSEEATEQNFRLLFLSETDLKNFLRYCDKLRQWNKQAVLEHYRLVLCVITMELCNDFTEI